VVALGLVGQLTPWKAQDDAIAMLLRLRARWPQVRLLLVGSALFTSGASRYDGRVYEQALRQTVAKQRLGDAVQFLGQRTELPQILRALDLLILPSWEEPFGMALLEGMAMGLPVVATTVGGPIDIVTDGEDGLLLPPRRPDIWAEEIDALLAQPERRAAMGETARRRATTVFTRRRYADGVVACYREALPSIRAQQRWRRQARRPGDDAGSAARGGT
jgi:D-inositol-3-phosphate glycosyltransferase